MLLNLGVVGRKREMGWSFYGPSLYKAAAHVREGNPKEGTRPYLRILGEG